MSATVQTALLLVLLAIGPGCDRWRPVPVPPHAAQEAWTPERIAADPPGYLQHTDQQIGRQLELGLSRLEALKRKAAELKSRSGTLSQELADARNVRSRLQSAVRRAQDEDRWPARFAGRSFTPEQAAAALANLDRFIAQQEPLAAGYDDAMRRIAAATDTAGRDIERLKALREKVAIDLERVRLDQNLAEMAEWRRNESELAAMSASLAQAAPDNLDALTPPAPQPSVSIDAMLGPR